MAGQVRVEEMTGQQPKQDCGCGCGGALCGTTRQQVILEGFTRPATALKGKASRCDCGCGCSVRLTGPSLFSARAG